ncbi:MAG: ABC transporter ATP-binding protein [Chloroflexi bacterium]|nr:ABC transporter ATP-binding protein [Chloroflexota bacterium]
MLLRLLATLRPHGRPVALAYACVLGATALNLVVPQLIRQVIDQGLSQRDSNVLVVSGGLILAVAALRGLFGFGRMYLTEWIANRTGYDLRGQLYERYQRLAFAFHDKAHTGDLMARATSDIDAVTRFTGNGLIDLVTIVLLFAGTVVAMCAASVPLTLVTMLPMPILIWVTFTFARRQRTLSKRAQDQMGRMSTALQENLTGVRVVKAFAREAHEIERFRHENSLYLGDRLAVVRSWARTFPFMNFVIAASVALLLWFGGLMVIRGEISVGELFAFNSYLVMLALPVQRLGFLVNIMSNAQASGERLFEILDLPSPILEKPAATALGEVAGHVRFENVSFAYDRDTVLHDVSFDARPNQVVALMGPTGSGKSTIISLLPRFYDVTGGRIMVDGRDIRDVPLASLRRQVGIVLQETFLFSTTVRENIAYFNRDADLERVVAAARAARAHDFIMELPDGYETRVGERGITLSGGQRQRIAIARALLMDPRILVLDDSLSAVDTETEYQIQQALATLMCGRTTFVVAQRLVTLKHADQIIVLDHGRVVQRGTHAELVAAPGLYRRIYDLQLRDQEAAAAANTFAAEGVTFQVAE